jgi:hypothetical protein
MPRPALVRFFPESSLWPGDSFLPEGNEGMSEGSDCISRILQHGLPGRSGGLQ